MAMKTKLTPRQRKIWKWMVQFQREHGYPASLREIGDRFKIQSTNGVAGHMKAMLKKGVVRTVFRQARSWQAIDPLESLPLRRVGTLDFSVPILEVSR